RTALVVGQSIQFIGASGGGIPTLSYQWDFDNDGTWDSTDQNPTWAYDAAGTYTVRLKVTDSAANEVIETKVGYITVYPVLQAHFSTDATDILEGQTVHFTDLTSGGIAPLTYEWDFDYDGTTPNITSTEQHPSHTYPVSGTYSVYLRVTDSASQSNSHTQARTSCVTVYAVPRAAFSATPTEAIVGGVAKFSDASTGDITSWNWAFGDGLSSTQQSPSHSYGAPGTYSVTLTVSNPAATDSYTRTDYITVYAAPEADFSAMPAGSSEDVWLTLSSGPVEILEGEAVSFMNLSGGGILPLSYEWDFDGDGNWDSTDQNPIQTYAAPGSCTVSLRVSDSASNTDVKTKAGYIVVSRIIVRQTVTSGGGTIAAEDEKILMHFPAGALSGETEITVIEKPLPTAPPAQSGFKLCNSYFIIEGADTLGQGVTLTVRYCDADVAAAGGNPQLLRLSYYDEDAEEWEVLDTVVDTEAKTLTVVTSHLSRWAILAQAPHPGYLGVTAEGWGIITGGLLSIVTLAWFTRRVIRRLKAREYAPALRRWEDEGYDVSDFKRKWFK
ncbi:MAG: hypothetical protein DRI40_09405, partial [Chloroflexi bacterium]